MLGLLKWRRDSVGGIGVYKAEFEWCFRKIRCVIRNWGPKTVKGAELDVQIKIGDLWRSMRVEHYWTVKEAKEKAETLALQCAAETPI